MQIIFLAVKQLYYLIKTETGEGPYQFLLIALVVGILFIAMPGTIIDFVKYIIDFFFDALHSAFGDDPSSSLGSGQKGDASNPLFDGIKLPGQNPQK